MPRLFWKIFLSLWLSIMGFAVMMAWVNTALVRQHIPDPPDVAFSRSIQRVEAMLSGALREGGPGRARDLIRRLPRHIRNHVYLLEENGEELLGRDTVRRHLQSTNVRHTRKELVDAHGRVYQLVVLRRLPPGRILGPGLPGIVHRLLLAGFVSAVVSFFLARFLARPLEELGRASRQLAAGDLSARVGLPLASRMDEFGTLARDFDEMAVHLQRLQQANRRLLRDVSHELRSPLARLRVALEIARNRDSAVVEDELDRIELESERLETLIDKVLDLLRESSESQPLRPETFDLAELLQDLSNVVSYEIPEGKPGVRLDVEGPMTVSADRELLWQAIENLLRNAVLYGGDDGVDLKGRFLEKGREAEITVADRGPGIPPAHLDRIFEPFYRVHESRDRRSGGHGLGLAIAAAAIRRHRGSIEARNRPSGGLVISIKIPSKA